MGELLSDPHAKVHAAVAARQARDLTHNEEIMKKMLERGVAPKLAVSYISAFQATRKSKANDTSVITTDFHVSLLFLPFPTVVPVPSRRWNAPDA